MTLKLKTMQQGEQNLEKRDLANYGIARFRDQVFDAVLALWRYRRDNDHWTQKDVADLIGRDSGWVSQNLRAPGNWTVKTAGELVQALRGELEIRVVPLEEPSVAPANYGAYEGYLPPTDAYLMHPKVTTVSVRVNRFGTNPSGSIDPALVNMFPGAVGTTFLGV